LDGRLGAERAPAWADPPEAAAALQEARPRRGRARRARAHEEARRRDRRVIDTHAHLDACDDRPSALIRRARSAGVERIITVGTGLGKPVVIHTRDADADTAALLAGFDGAVVMHCFSSPGLLNTVLERGYYVSFAGNVTYPKASDLRATAAQVPDERILAETDSPYLAPQARRGRPNEPANAVLTVEELAKVRGVDAADLGARIEANAASAFSLPLLSRSLPTASSASTSSWTITSPALSAAPPS